LNYLEAISGEKIIPIETLIIFNEIQSNVRALTSLKNFCEDAPDIHIATARSLLGVSINREKNNFPVGKIDELSLYPLDYEEFLWAMDKEAIVEEIKKHFSNNAVFPEALHNTCLELYKYYLIIGRMPAAIKEYLDTKSLLGVSDVLGNILNNYIADMIKYASATTAVKIRACYNSIPVQLVKENAKFQYKVVQKGGTATIFG
jgi:uncharacterized protein